MTQFYHDGNRSLQSAFGSRDLAERLAGFTRTEFTPDDRMFIESLPFFFLATSDAEGRPDCSFKGGNPGFVQVVGPGELAFPDYDGNGMFRSLGNLAVNPAVGLLFIAMSGRPRRLRLNGTATCIRNDPLLATMPGAQMVVRVTAQAIFPNCPRYIPAMTLTALSPYSPEEGRDSPEPAWKSFPEFRDVVPPRKPTHRA